MQLTLWKPYHEVYLSFMGTYRAGRRPESCNWRRKAEARSDQMGKGKSNLTILGERYVPALFANNPAVHVSAFDNDITVIK